MALTLRRGSPRDAVASLPEDGERDGFARPANASPPAAKPAPAVTLVARPELLRTIATCTAGSGRLETGGPLIGTVQRSWDGASTRLIVSILGTVPPGPAVRASYGSVAMGRGADGERAASALRWWRDVTGLELVHLGDWHKHPSGMPEPSGGDRMTAQKMRADSPAPVWLTAVAVCAMRRSQDFEAAGEFARFTRAWAQSGQVRFYQATDGKGLVRVPVRLEDGVIPQLPALPWHIVDPSRFAAECRLLHAAGFTVAIDAATPGGRPGISLRLLSDGARPVTVVTGSRYPHQPPVLCDERGDPMKLRSQWSRDHFLVDLVRKAC